MWHHSNLLFDKMRCLGKTPKVLLRGSICSGPSVSYGVPGMPDRNLDWRKGLRQSDIMAMSSIIGQLFAGEKGVRSSVGRDNSIRGAGGCRQRIFVRSQCLSQEVGVAGQKIRTAHQDVAPE